MICKHNLPAGCCMVCAHEQRLERYRQNLAAGITPEPARRDDGSLAPRDDWLAKWQRGQPKRDWHDEESRLERMME